MGHIWHVNLVTELLEGYNATFKGLQPLPAVPEYTIIICTCMHMHVHMHAHMHAHTNTHTHTGSSVQIFHTLLFSLKASHQEVMVSVMTGIWLSCMMTGIWLGCLV